MNDPTRTVYRPGVPKSISDRMFGRWRGVPIDLNHDQEMWACRDSSVRHLRELLRTFRSETFHRLRFPDLFFTVTTSAAIVAHNLWVAYADFRCADMVEKAGFDLLLHHDMLSLPPEPFTFSAFALGLILAFRTNSSHARYVEARTFWGYLVNLSRDIASRFTASVPKDESAARAQRKAVALVCSFAHVMKYHLTVDGCNQHIPHVTFNTQPAEAKAALEEALRDELILVWGEEHPYIDALLAHDVIHKPMHVLHELRRLSLSPILGFDSIASAQVGDRIFELANVLGGCERLLRTPIYTPYTNHLSRFLFVWCCALPLAMYPLVGPLGTVPVSVVITYFMLGIEDIGVRTEMPFDLLPLWQYAETIDASCTQILDHQIRCPAWRAAERAPAV